jgi:hypothetical protein
MIISFPKNHFYPEFSGQAILHWIFYILHFHNHEFTNFFSPQRRELIEVSQRKSILPIAPLSFVDFPLRGIKGEMKGSLCVNSLTLFSAVKIIREFVVILKKTALLPEERFQKKIIIQ